MATGRPYRGFGAGLTICGVGTSGGFFFLFFRDYSGQRADRGFTSGGAVGGPAEQAWLGVEFSGWEEKQGSARALSVWPQPTSSSCPLALTFFWLGGVPPGGRQKHEYHYHHAQRARETKTTWGRVISNP